MAMAKSKFIKTKIAAIASTLMLTTIDANALGLGTINVQSNLEQPLSCLLYTSPSPRDKRQSRMPSSA